MQNYNIHCMLQLFCSLLKQMLTFSIVLRRLCQDYKLAHISVGICGLG